MATVLVSSGPLRNRAGAFRAILAEAGLETVEPPGEHALSADELMVHLSGCDAVIAGGEVYSAELLGCCPRLKVIARTGVGYDAVDVDAATRRGIVVTITPGTNHDSVAEQAFGLLLAVTRRVAWNDRLIRRGGWDRTLVMPLRGKRMGLVGLGRIGKAMVPRAHAFGMSVCGFDPLVRDPRGCADLGVAQVGFEELLAESDVVSLHCPLTAETHRLFDLRVFGRMKRGAILINTARGGVVDEGGLWAALVSGQLAGAGLDVLDPEPPSRDNPLLQLDQVVFSPHIAGIDTQAMSDMAEAAARCIVEVLAGRDPGEAVVNPGAVGREAGGGGFAGVAGSV